ncbi:MAG TPA: hypothetical protein VLB02_02295 [Candidatus Paceibacterota bacterium]|nr:hypothetical protein [Candidatus Paceibacterota bacterium]
MEKLLKALNKLVFLTPRTETDIQTIQKLAIEIQKDFVFSTYWLGLIDNYTEQFKKPNFKSAIRRAMWAATHYVRPGSGFTPKLSTIEDDKSLGYNCLGRAIMLGSNLRYCKYKFKVFLGITPDHAMVLIELKNTLYLCDSLAMKLRKLHGTCNTHEGYRWYLGSPEDEFMNNYLVIHEFDRGIVNAIVESFIFLQEPPQNPSGAEQEFLVFKDPRFKLHMAINQLCWRDIQKKYFSDLNEYRNRYRKEYLLECVFIEKQRHVQNLRAQFNQVTRSAYEKAFKSPYDNEKHKSFIVESTFILQSIHEHVIRFLEGNVSALDLPVQLGIYLQTIRERVGNNAELQQFTIDKFKYRMSTQISI